MYLRELFNAAFVSCWMELTPIQKEDLVVNFKQALLVPNIPEITQTLLNLAEFMEHCEEATVSSVYALESLYVMKTSRLEILALQLCIDEH